MHPMHCVIFLGSQEPVQFPKHFTQVPSSLRAYPYEQDTHALLLQLEHPVPHFYVHEPDDSLYPLLHDRHWAKLDVIQVLQLPAHARHAPLINVV